MSRRTATALAAAVVITGVAVVAWRAWSGGEERAIQTRLDALARQVNTSATDGLGIVARAAELGTFFTDDVVVDLGQGAAPIVGRQTLVGMATRLQPRTAAFELAFADVTVHMLMADEADVELTATFTRKGTTAADRSIDAREFALTMRKVGGGWQIARVAAVDTLK
jgi:hypothetical protein